MGTIVVNNVAGQFAIPFGDCIAFGRKGQVDDEAILSEFERIMDIVNRRPDGSSEPGLYTYEMAEVAQQLFRSRGHPKTSAFEMPVRSDTDLRALADPLRPNSFSIIDIRATDSSNNNYLDGHAVLVVKVRPSTRTLTYTDPSDPTKLHQLRYHPGEFPSSPPWIEVPPSLYYLNQTGVPALHLESAAIIDLGRPE